MTEPKCPKCGSEKTSATYYSCPAQADCSDCGFHYEFGEGPRIIFLAEGIKTRPQMYKEYLCSKCGKYKLEAHLEEDKIFVCTCDKEN